jgi:RNA polymerase sigma factor (sigma-70 family)
MQPDPDATLLRRYAETREETAFTEFVGRRLNGVYATALRRVGGDTHLAEDVAQKVFVAVARQAGTLARHPDLTGWLYTTTRHQTANVVRAERRRKAREQKAEAMAENLLGRQSPAAEADWSRVAPVLDDAIEQLAAVDRAAILLRFVERRAFGEIGAALRLSEDAARMRVDRALDKLRVLLGRRGIASTSAALGLALANQAAASAPVGLATTVTSAALASTAAGGGALATLAFFTMSKIKIGIVSAIVMAGLATVAVEGRANLKLRAEMEALRCSSQVIARLRSENQSANLTLQKLESNNPEADEVARLQRRIAVLKARPDGVTDVLMKPAAEWRNAGRATPAEAMETGLWAAKAGDLDAFAGGYVYSDNTKARMKACFEELSDSAQARYRTPERFFHELEMAMIQQAMPEAFQVLEEKREFDKPEGTVVLEIWFRGPAGDERLTTARFQRDHAGWFGVGNDYSDEQWARKIAKIDPVTGGLRPTGK